jgi:hypothetical protein
MISGHGVAAAKWSFMTHKRTFRQMMREREWPRDKQWFCDKPR